MKKHHLLSIALLVFTSIAAQAQSKSFDILKERFQGTGNVHTISVGGFFCRAVLWLAGEDEFRDAIKELNHVRMISIPKENFREQQLTLNGFRKILLADQFESLATVREQGERIEVFIQKKGNRKNKYFVLVEEEHEVLGIEIKGDIDIEKLCAKKEVVQYNL